MEIKTGLWIVKKKSSIGSNISGKWIEETDPAKINILLQLRKASTQKNIDKIDELIKQYKSLMPSEELLKAEEKRKNNMIEVCKKLIDFFKEFEFEPNFRFVNTLRQNAKSIQNAQQYVINYFSLSNNQYKDSIAEKIKSPEFKTLITVMSSITSTNIINKRFKIYYGSQGTGKTTQAMKESAGVVMVCHSAMLPSDLLEDFKFEDGKPGFKKSSLWLAMENGTKITLDEINLLPFESLRFLQSILDNKSEICYKGQTIHIKDGFQIIGTMNLVVNGSIFNLPEPLVDRACELKEYQLTAEQLIGALE